MKKLMLFLFIALTIGVGGAKPRIRAEKGIHFMDSSLAQAIERAKQEKKLIFIDIYATWCGPCAMLKLRTFSNKDVGNYFNDNFISLSLDGEKGEGLQLFRTYRLQAFPTLIILDASGKPLLATEGYMDPKSLIDFGKAGVAKLNR